MTSEPRPWDEFEIRVLWAEANRPILGDAATDAWAHKNILATNETYRPVAATITGQPGADSLMEVLHGTPAPTPR